MGLTPDLPIDIVSIDRFQLLQHPVVLREYHKVLAFPPGGWRNQSIQAQEVHGGADFLGDAVIALSIPFRIDSETFQVALEQS